MNIPPNAANGKKAPYPFWALAGFLYGAILAVGAGQVSWMHMLPILLLTLLLDLFPIRLISGEEFGAGLIGFLSLLIGFGLYTALLGVFISCLANESRQCGFRPASFDPVRWLVRLGIYTLSTCGAALALQGLHAVWTDAPLYAQAAAAALMFEAVRLPLDAGMRKMLSGKALLSGVRERLKEALVPILLCVVVIPHFLRNLLEKEMLGDLIYTGLLLFFILYFSGVYIREVAGWRRTFERFSLLFESRLSPDLEGHGIRTGVIADHLLERLSYPRKKKRVFIQAAIQHDIGKSALPAYLFTKRGALSLSEEDEYRSHSEKGAEIVRTLIEDDRAALWVRHHHECWDGRGFPAGLRGKNIPYESRILALSSRLDHLLRREGDDQAVCAYVAKLSGREIDPALAAQVDLHFVQTARERLELRGLVSGPLQENGNKRSTLPEQAEEARAVLAEEQGSFVGLSTMLKLGADGLLYGLEQPELEAPIVRLARRAEADQTSFYELLSCESRTYEAHFYPENREVRIALTDITPALAYRERLRTETLSAYREIISALSEGRVRLCETDGELLARLGARLDSVTVAGKADIGRSRDLAASYMEAGDPKRLMQVKLAVSEAATNMLKHALGGEVTVFARENVLQIFVRDEGSGIALHDLPKTFVVSGYSSKRSLGRGFGLMYASTDRIFLYTDSDGTRLLLEFDGISGRANGSRGRALFESSSQIPS
ncbi:HD domain-containing phosphohydrolase [Saccharibacillus alkalitolerans]|uniref:HD domain-containing protein n=1 Tax=Saccharibacillus alkalitolerans TaxID=2705290 RepID=A0ABX0EYH0_9BACL|nr:HD domain-containing phosphohydrolase [Saccharibacillus alkalitolerans]NGZ73792.1 HD domain-containing protein [Saccharibacillus alkalitolerans]